MKTTPLGFVVVVAVSSCAPRGGGEPAKAALPREAEDDVPARIKEALAEKVSVQYDQEPLGDALAELARARCEILVDRAAWDSDRMVTLKLTDVELSRALDAVIANSGLERSVFAEAVYIATPEQTAIARKTTALEDTKNPELERWLSRRVSFCHPRGDRVHHDLVKFFKTLTKLEIITRLPEDEGHGARFTFYDHEMDLRNALRWMAVNWDLDLRLEGDVIVFVPRKQTAQRKPSP